VYDPARGYPAAVPYLLYRDPGAAARWITEILGFAEAIRFTVPGGGPAGHIELARGGAVLMVGLAGGRFGETASVTLVFVDDVGAACARIPAAGGSSSTGLPTSRGGSARPSWPIPKASAGNLASTCGMSRRPTGVPNCSASFPASGVTCIRRAHVAAATPPMDDVTLLTWQ
jgi:hypothetical protein